METKISKKTVIFKKYDQKQYVSVPIDISSFIGEGHIVRIIDGVVEAMDMSVLESYYVGGGRSNYHPKMLIKVWLYGYCTKVYTSRPLSKALVEQLPFMWLAGGQSPCFKTLSDFRGNRLQGLIDDVFKEVLLMLIDQGYINLEDIYMDGSKWEANGNKFKVIWAKNTERYKAGVLERIEILLQEVHALQAAEDAQYGTRHLESMGEGKDVSIVLNSEQVRSQIQSLESLIAQKAEKVEQMKDKTAKKRVTRLTTISHALEKEQVKIEKYEQQEVLLNGRNSYSKTDNDATMLWMKDEQVLPAYNVQHSTNNQFVTNYTVGQTASDSPTLPEHLDKLEQRFEGIAKPEQQNVIADAGYGSEENYTYLQSRGMEAYVKYPLFYQEQTGEILKLKFRRENFAYDAQDDTFTCPNNRKLKFDHEEKKTTQTGYEKDIRVYLCESCEDCPFAADCKKKEHGQRSVQLSRKGEAFKEQAKEKLTSEKGREFRKQRGIEVESVFGDLKYNMKHERFMLRSLEKVYVEYGLLSIAHNLRKVYCDQSGIWADYYAQRAAKKVQKRA
jgi:transposase